MKRLFSCLLIIIGLVAGNHVCQEQPVAAATRPAVLLVYDSQHSETAQDQPVADMTRLLLGLGQSVTQVALSQYHAGELNRKYTAVMRMVNWQASPQNSAAFDHDWAQFTGKKIHIGARLPQDFIRTFGAGEQVTHLQLQLQDETTNVRQLLPFTATTWTLYPAVADAVGRLQVQGTSQTYGYGLMTEDKAYLPFFDQNGLTGLLAQRLLARFLTGQAQKLAPALLITGVTPTTSPKQLRQVTTFLRQQGISFALSATLTAKHVRLPEHAAYLAALANSMQAGGQLIWQWPQLSQTIPADAKAVQRLYLAQVKQAIQNGLYPSGISGDIRTALTPKLQALYRQTNTQWLLPSMPTADASAHTVPQTANTTERAFWVMPLRRWQTIEGANDGDSTAAAPLALQMALPTTAKALAQFKQDLRAYHGTWFDFSSDAFTNRLVAGNVTVTSQFGQYWRNGKPVTVASGDNPHQKRPQAKRISTRLNGFFNWQERFLLIFMLIMLVILAVLLRKGSKLYRDKFRR